MDTQILSTAYHEAGHAVFAWMFGIRIRKVTAVPSKVGEGNTAYDDTPPLPKDFHQRVAWLALAGGNAQRRFLNGVNIDEIQNCSSPSDRAAALLANVQTFGDLLDLENRVNATLEREDVWAAISEVANLLVEVTELSGQQIAAICERHIDRDGVQYNISTTNP